jgi:hypothetical protein
MPSAAPKKVLAISPYFVPANTPDMQRLRMALPYFAENGWEATVAAADPCGYEAPVDENLARSVPEDAKILHLPVWPEAACRRFGFGHLSNRIVVPWRKAVKRLLEEQKFDLVFFTTTQAMVMVNGPYWRRKTGVPYVIDLQDPIYVPGGSYTRKNAPGAYWKYRVSQFLSRYVERSAFAAPSAVVATSALYLDTLRDRYPHLRGIPMSAIPFGVAEKDIAEVDAFVPENPLFARSGEEKVLLYAGRGGPDLHAAMRALFAAAGSLGAEASKLRFLFVGTSYGPKGSARRQVVPIAEECGVGHLVEEQTHRSPYFHVLKATKEADCAIVLGSESADYTASKALAALAAARLVIAVVHSESMVRKLYEGQDTAMVCDFLRSPSEPDCIAKIVAALRKVAGGALLGSRPKQIPVEFTARDMTRSLTDVFAAATSKVGAHSERHV